jgi:hypothetical protein
MGSLGAATRRGCVFAPHGVLVRGTAMGSVARRRHDFTPDTEHSEEEEPNPVGTFAYLRCRGFGLMTVSHANPARSRVPHPPAHAANANGLDGRRETPRASTDTCQELRPALPPA